jgi:hypothetical protein
MISSNNHPSNHVGLFFTSTMRFTAMLSRSHHSPLRVAGRRRGLDGRRLTVDLRCTTSCRGRRLWLRGELTEDPRTSGRERGSSHQRQLAVDPLASSWVEEIREGKGVEVEVVARGTSP